jgi:hypothetical protein
MNRYSEEQVRRASKERLSAMGFEVSQITTKSNNDNQTVSEAGESASSKMSHKTSKGRWFTPGGTVFSCKKNKTSNQWNTYTTQGYLCLEGGTGPHHPGYPGNAEAKKWVMQLVKAADNISESNPETIQYDVIDFTYQLKTPNSNDDAHDIFRCHPNFHGSDSKKNPWHDWAMLSYEEDIRGKTEYYEVAGKVCLWAVFRNSKQKKSSTAKLDVYGAFHPLKEYTPHRDEILPFLRKDVLAKNIEILPFDAVVSTAYILPINWSRSTPFPTTPQEAKAYCVIPPRSSWPDIGWDDKLLRPTAMKDTKNLPFI